MAEKRSHWAGPLLVRGLGTVQQCLPLAGTPRVWGGIGRNLLCQAGRGRLGLLSGSPGGAEGLAGAAYSVAGQAISSRFGLEAAGPVVDGPPGLGSGRLASPPRYCRQETFLSVCPLRLLYSLATPCESDAVLCGGTPCPAPLRQDPVGVAAAEGEKQPHGCEKVGTFPPHLSGSKR